MSHTDSMYYWIKIMNMTFTLDQIKQASKHGYDSDPKFLEQSDLAYRAAAVYILKERGIS